MVKKNMSEFSPRHPAPPFSSRSGHQTLPQIDLQRAWGAKMCDLGTALLRCLPPEWSHHLGLKLIEGPWIPEALLPPAFTAEIGLKCKVPGIGLLSHPVGLAAGFDKNAVAPHGFRRLGFSMIEVGTVTPRAQLGNPKPRLFRYPDERALINRMGFNNDGALQIAARLKASSWNQEITPLGVNCGKNKDTPNKNAVGDYLQVIDLFHPLAQYLVVNISSPNTPGLRELATPEFVQQLGHELGPKFLPKVWIKVDPDLPRRDFQRLVQTISDVGFQGIILTNTHRVQFPESGGQSGHPLLSASTSCLEWAYEVHRGKLPMIAAGGILSGIDIFQKIVRGALAVQIYTALVYRGPWTVYRLLLELVCELKLRGFSSIEEAQGSFYDRSS